MMVVRQFMKLALTELRVSFREPIGMFFNFIMPPFMLFLMMEVFIPADVPTEIVINYVTPRLMVLIIAGSTIFGVPLGIAGYRQIKFLKRLKASPVAPLTLLGSLGLVSLIATVLGIALLTAVAMLVYGAGLAGSPISFLAGFVLAFLSLAAIFLFIAGVVRSPRTCLVISQVAFFVMMFFSGVFIPMERLPDWIARYISPILPVTPAVELMQGLWLGIPFFDLTREVLILLAFLCLGLFVAARTFRWE